MIKDGEFAEFFGPRDPEGHKGSFGKCVCAVGSMGMAGAAVLSAKAALLCGAGLCKCVLPLEIYPIVSSAIPEATFSVWEGEKYLATLSKEIKTASAVLIGCGCGKSQLTELAVKLCIDECECPLVIDADGINMLSRHINWLEKHSGEIVLTPHPAEMARLLKTDIPTVQSDRKGVAGEFARKYGVTVVLKGHGTVVAQKDGCVEVNPTGNPGMATGGSGDVLAGMAVSFLAQGMPAAKAAKAAVYIHGAAGDRAAQKKSQRGMLPSDILLELPSLFLEYEKGGK